MVMDALKLSGRVAAPPLNMPLKYSLEFNF